MKGTLKIHGSPGNLAASLAARFQPAAQSATPVFKQPAADRAVLHAARNAAQENLALGDVMLAPPAPVSIAPRVRRALNYTSLFTS